MSAAVAFDTHHEEYTVPQSVSRAVELAEGVASLGLLRKIDRAVDTLVADARNFGFVTRQLHDIADGIMKAPVTKGEFLDPDDHVTDILARAEERLKDYLPYMVLKLSAIDKDGSLSEDHRESLHDAYEEWMVASATMLEAFEQVRNSIISYDLDALEWEKQPSFGSVEEAIAYLHECVAQK